jgi:NitT/TauT family transport system substrate-binding protein
MFAIRAAALRRLAVRAGFIAFASLSVALLTACGEKPSEPLRIASSPWPGYEPLYLARDLGYLPANRATVFELPSSDITLESFRNRSADLATLTLDETLDLLQSGIKLRIVAVMDSSNGADAVMARPEIKTLRDLKGRRIAIENIPLGVYMLTRTLNAAGLTRADVQVVPLSENKHEQLYKQNKVDALITFEPFKSQLTALGAHIIFDSSRIPNEIFDLLVVHESVYQQRKADVCNIARQWYRTLGYMHTAPEDSEQRIARRLGVDVPAYRNMAAGIVIPTLTQNRALLAGDHPALLPAAKLLTHVMLHEGQLHSTVDLRTALAPDLQECAGQ